MVEVESTVNCKRDEIAVRGSDGEVDFLYVALRDMHLGLDAMERFHKKPRTAVWEKANFSEVLWVVRAVMRKRPHADIANRMMMDVSMWIEGQRDLGKEDDAFCCFVQKMAPVRAYHDMLKAFGNREVSDAAWAAAQGIAKKQMSLRNPYIDR